MSGIPQVIIVGGGLSGLSAAHTVIERGGRVLLLDKNSFLGGNSTKATSGINGSGTSTQRSLNQEDSPEVFYNDTALSARELIRPDLVRTLTYNSASAVEWLKSRFKLDLSLLSRLGGHSNPRTHRGKERFPGMTITYALLEKLEDLAKSHPERAQIYVKAHVQRLLTEGEKIVGVEYTKSDGSNHQERGPVILATGGYAADFTDSSLIKKYRPDIYHLPTTNGDYSTGDGHKMAINIGGNVIDLEKIQVHPTGLINPKDPNAKVLFLAAEALRGVGGILLTNDGLRFCDELGHRDYVTGEMWRINKSPYYLVLNGASSRQIGWHCKHYIGRGLMKRFNSATELCDEMKIPPHALQETFRNYNQIAETGACPFGKKFFAGLPFEMDDEYCVSIVTPVLHYTMGGVEINDRAEIQSKSGSMPGLFASGELAGGVHGANRLGGSSLLGCVVFGRIAGDSASSYLLNQLSQRSTSYGGISPIQLNSQRLMFTPKSNTLCITLGNFGSSSETGPLTASVSQIESTVASPQVPASLPEPSSKVPEDVTKSIPSGESSSGLFSIDEVSKHNRPDDCWVIIQGQVLDVTKFMHEHPGGSKAILLYAGKDATEEFLMLHEPGVISRYAPNVVLGSIKGDGLPIPMAKL